MQPDRRKHDCISSTFLLTHFLYPLPSPKSFTGDPKCPLRWEIDSRGHKTSGTAGVVLIASARVSTADCEMHYLDIFAVT